MRGRSSGWSRLRPAQSCPFCLNIPIMFEFTKTVGSLGKNKYHQTIVVLYKNYSVLVFLDLDYDVRTIHSLFFITFVIATHNYFKVTFPSFSETAVKRYLLDKLLSVSPGFKNVKVFSPNFKNLLYNNVLWESNVSVVYQTYFTTESSYSFLKNAI